MDRSGGGDRGCNEVAKIKKPGLGFGRKRVSYVSGIFHQIGDWDYPGSHEHGVALHRKIVDAYEGENKKGSGEVSEYNSGGEGEGLARAGDRGSVAITRGMGAERREESEGNRGAGLDHFRNYCQEFAFGGRDLKVHLDRSGGGRQSEGSATFGW